MDRAEGRREEGGRAGPYGLDNGSIRELGYCYVPYDG